MAKRKILIITDNFEFKGGMKVMAKRVCRQFPEDEVRLLSSVSRKYFFGTAGIWGIFFPLNFIYLFKVLFLTLYLIGKLKVFSKIIIVSPSPLLGIIAILLNRKADIWYATTLPDEIGNKRSLFKVGMKMKVIIIIERFLLPIYYLLENMVLNNRNLDSYALSTSSACYYNTKSKVAVIRYPIECGWGKHSEETRKKQYDIISVGRFNDPRKNLKMLLIVSLLLPQYRFALIGPLPSNINIKEFKNISFIGEIPRAEIEPFYKASKIFFLPSLQEGLGIVYLEAMSAGLPVITPDNGGSRDLIREGYNGCFISPVDVNGCAEKIKKLLSNENNLNNMSANSVEFIVNYSQKESKLFNRIFN